MSFLLFLHILMRLSVLTIPIFLHVLESFYFIYISYVQNFCRLRMGCVVDVSEECTAFIFKMSYSAMNM